MPIPSLTEVPASLIEFPGASGNRRHLKPFDSPDMTPLKNPRHDHVVTSIAKSIVSSHPSILIEDPRTGIIS
jgi:hypothetical protein